MKHEIVKRIKDYEPGDCYSYTIKCSCGKEFNGWSILKFEDDFSKHCLIID